MNSTTIRKIPEPLYSQVLDLALKITNASEAGDSIAQSAAFLELQEFHEELKRVGSSDPFVTETLADFTLDDQQAIILYKLAISQSVAFEGEPIHTKKIALALRYIDLDNSNVARDLLLQARVEANAFGDIDSIKETDNLLAQIDD
ncbi:MAG: hypothetical protein KGO49_10185 [Gammaproteobacteria bacterium]|nr:hypothetical protein [Gammaproteobacteria bacterium]